jgi:transcriptional regulator with XRE-family HTH domain
MIGYPAGMKNPKANPSPQVEVRWYLQQWREKAGLTQAQLAERMHTSAGMISEHEAGTRRFNDDWMARWAAALRIKPIDLLRHPDDVDVERQAQDYAVSDLLVKLSADQREEALRFLRFLASQSGDK